MAYIDGAIKLNNGTYFCARKDDETGEVFYMNHQGMKKASQAIAETFKKGYGSVVKPSDRYRFPDSYENPHQSFTSAKDAEWRERPSNK